MIASRKVQRGYLLVMVVVMLFLIASIAMLLSYDSAMNANSSSAELEAARADYVTEAAMQHALWKSANNTCMGNVTIPATTLGAGSYSATVTGAAAGTFYTLTADQDAWIRDDQPTNNKGGDSSLHIKDSQIEQPLYRFDLSSLPAGAQINFAVASFYVSGEHPEEPVTVHRITAGWNEGDVTWDSISGSVDSGILATIPAQPDNDVRVQVNITGQVQAWVNGQPNNGILLASTAPGIHAQYVSREGASNQHPRLDVVVGSGPASPVAIQAIGTLDNGVTRTLNRPIYSAYQPPGIRTLQLGTDPGADAVLDDFYPRNYGGADFVELNGDPSWLERPLLRFDLGGIPARAAVLSAQLELGLRSINTPGTATVHRVTRSWVEGTKSGTGTADGATWATYDGTNSWTTAGGDFNAAPVAETAINGGETWVSWEIGPLVEQWLAGEPNNGLLLKGDAALREAEFYTKEEADATLRPKLTITYACECGSACMAPQGSGNILMVVRSATNMWYYDLQKKAIFESWGYNVNIIDDGASAAEFEAGIAANDVAYISEPVTASEINTKLTDAAIGVISDEGRMNHELGMAQSYATPVLGSAINVTDTSHFITSVFAVGPLDIYSADMEGLTIAGNESPDLQTLADWGGAGSLVVLDANKQMESGGTVPGRRVMLPFGRQVDSNVNWDYINGNGLLIAQRAIAWGMNADAGSSGTLLLVVGDATNLTTEDAAKKAVIESWGYAVVPISDEEPQATVDAALASADVVYIAESVTSGNVSTKYTGTTIGVLNEEGDLDDELGFSSTNITYWATDVSIVDNSHYITETFASGPLTIVDSSQRMNALAGTMAGGIQNLAISGSNSALDILDSGAALWGGGSAAGRRVKLPWATGTDFDINALNDDGRTMLKRAIEWGAGAGAAASPGYNVLLIVGNDTTLASKDVGYKALMESWGHTVAVIDDGASQAVYDTAMAAADVIYASGSAVGSSMLDKATYTTKGLVNEVSGKIDNFGFSSSKSATATFDAFSSTNASHYITEPFSGDPVTVFTSSLTNPVPGGTLAPDLQNVGQVSSTLVLGTLDAGATRYDSTPSQGRRAHLPFTSAETTDMTADGKTILQRAIEWAAGADSGGGGGTLLLVVGDATNLTTEDAAKKAVIESWNYTVTVISDEESQANIDAALADADVVYITESVTSGTVSTKFTAATIGVLNEEGDLNDDLGMSSGNITYWATDLNITDNSHYITETFAAGPLTIVDLSQRMNALGATMAAGNQNLATSGSNSALDILDSGAALWGGGSATGRRVKLPWATGTDFDINALNANGLTILQRAIEWAAGAGSGGGGGGGGGGGCDGTFRDEFNARSFTGSDGTLTWAGDWLEVGESDGPASGDTQIRTDQSNYQLRTRDNNNGGEGVEREADLTGAASATLSYVYRRSGLDSSSDYTSVEVSANGAAGPWTELTRHQGSGSDSSYQTASHNISSFVSINTRIRFKTSSSMGGTDTVWFDNVEIACTP